MLLTNMSRLKVSRSNNNRAPLEWADIPIPSPKENELLVKISACGVCHTELDEIEGRMPPPRLPIVPGHQAVGTVVEKGNRTERFHIDDRIGIAWIHSSCGRCRFCRVGRENLCPGFKATGRDANGGYAEYMTIQESYAYPVPADLTDAEVAPLLCAGAVGYRSILLSGIQDGLSLGLSGFGASAHLVLKTVKHLYPRTKVFVFARGVEQKQYALELGAFWSGNSEDLSPEKLSAIIDTTPAWKPIVESMKNLESGGRLVINAIRKEEKDKEYLQRIDYPRDLWMEKNIQSVANVTRKDVTGFLELAGKIAIKPEVQEYPLEQANEALFELKQGKIRGAKVLRMDRY